MLITLTGKPGVGKTLTLVYLAYSNFKQKNPPLKVWFTEKILRRDWIYDISEYSDFPIIFKKPRKKPYYVYDDNGDILKVDSIYSLKWRIFDLFIENKFRPSANFYSDEIQTKYDSMEYKDFPDCIAHYCQAHRHFDNNIYVSSQSQSRIIKRILVLTEEFWNIQTFTKLFGFGICSIRRTWEKSASLEDNAINDNMIDVDYFKKFYRIKRIGSMYDSKYLHHLQDNMPLYPSKMYDTLDLSREDLLKSFFPTEAEKEALKRKRY